MVSLRIIMANKTQEYLYEIKSSFFVELWSESTEINKWDKIIFEFWL